MKWFLSAIDLSDNITRGLHSVRGITGLPALILSGALTLICVALAPLCWYFDLDATLSASDTAVQFVIPTLPTELLGAAAFIALALTLLPTLIELFGARFAAANILLASLLVYLFSLFDMVTDWPRVAAFCDAYRYAFDGLGFVAPVVFFAFRLLFLFLASFGFELLFIVFAVCALALLLNSGRSPRAEVV